MTATMLLLIIPACGLLLAAVLGIGWAIYKMLQERSQS